MINEAVSFLSNGDKLMDIDGEWAASGTCNQKLKQEVLSLPYFS
jgi:1,6-anhydro-N-acetylmuramate kinase